MTRQRAGSARAALQPRGAVLAAAALLLVGLGPLADAAALTAGGRAAPSWLAAVGTDVDRLRSEPAGPAVDGRRDSGRTPARMEGPGSWSSPPVRRGSACPAPWALCTERHSDAGGFAAPTRAPELSRPPPFPR